MSIKKSVREPSKDSKENPNPPPPPKKKKSLLERSLQVIIIGTGSEAFLGSPWGGAGFEGGAGALALSF